MNEHTPSSPDKSMWWSHLLCCLYWVLTAVSLAVINTQLVVVWASFTGFVIFLHKAYIEWKEQDQMYKDNNDKDTLKLTISVPRLPTEEMLRAARVVAPFRDGKPMPDKVLILIWANMVAAGRSY